VLSLKAIELIYLASLLSALAFLFIAKALRHIAISGNSPLLVFGPVFTAIIAVILLGENMTLVQAAGIILIVIGAYLLESHAHQNILEPFKHILRIKHTNHIFLGLFLYALCSVINKKIIGAPIDGGMGVPVFTFIALIHFFIGVNFVLMMLFFHDGFKGIERGLKNNWKWLLLAGVLALGYRLAQHYAISLPGVLVSLAIPIKRLSALFATLLGGELFHEKHILRRSLACTVMIIGAVLILL